jgi:hypothetical protein
MNDNTFQLSSRRGVYDLSKDDQRSEKYITLYHDTSSNRAAKIVGSKFYHTRGFRPGIDTAVFFAEDLKTAEFFARTTKWATGETPARTYTVIEFRLLNKLANELDLLKTYHIGEFRKVRFMQPGDSSYERILIGDERLTIFNNYLKQGVILTRRLRLP